jgi:hypothetical protein
MAERLLPDNAKALPNERQADVAAACQNRFPEFRKPSVCRMQSISARLRRALSLFVSLHSMVSRQLKV